MKNTQTTFQNLTAGRMKTMRTAIAAGALLASTAIAQSTPFTVTDLGTVGPAGQPFLLTNNTLISGAAMVGNTLHGVLYYKGRTIDLATPGLKGENSMAFGVNVSGQAVGEAQTLDPDPAGEDFCGFAALGLPSSGGSCLPFLWQNGVMNPLPTLGGNNGAANQINSRGDAAGIAENMTPDSTCPSGGPQKYQFKPVVWQKGTPRELPTFPGDPDGTALAINDLGQIAGGSGDCTAFSPITLTSLFPHHALLWENGIAADLGTLGGTGHGFGIEAVNLNNRGQVVGNSDLAGDAGFHAFLWTRETGMKDLGTVPGDVNSLATGINDAGDVVGVSLDAGFTPRAFLRQGEDLIDLNELVPAASSLYLASACSINARGEIIGIAIDKISGDVHGYLAIPNPSGHTRPAAAARVTPVPGSGSTARPQFQRFGAGRR